MFKLFTNPNRALSGANRPGSHALARLASIALVIAAFCPVLNAQTRDQPIQIEANTAEYSDRTGISTYSGAVVLTQGTLVLHGDKLTVTRNKDSGAIEAILNGEPATLDKPADNENTEAVDGRAQSMEYKSDEAVLILTGQARVTRGGDTIRGDTIRHYLNSARTQASSTGQGERVKITIQPESADEADNAGDATEPAQQPTQPETQPAPATSEPPQPTAPNGQTAPQ